MWYLLVIAGLYYFRGQIAQRIAPFLPSVEPQRLSLCGHTTILVTAALFLLPIELVGLGALKRAVYQVSLWSSALTSMYTIKANCGAPPVPQDVSLSNLRKSFTPMKEACIRAVQPWLMKAMSSNAFHFLFFSLIFLTAHPSFMALMILGRWSLWTICTHSAKSPSPGRLWGMFSPYWQKLVANEKQVLLCFAMAEILQGLWLTVSLALPSRQFLTCLLYWNYLKMRYQVPRSREYHGRAWGQLEGQVAPLVKRAPILQKPIDMGKGWFRPPGM